MRESDISSSLPVVKSELKPPHSWAVSISGDNAANTAKVQGYALCLSTKRMGLPRTSPIMLLPCHEITEARLSPSPLSSPNRSHAARHHSCRHTEAHEKPPYAQQESQCVRRLKERIARMGGLG